MPDPDIDLANWRVLAFRLEDEVKKAMVGQDRAVRLCNIAVFARGHVLLEGDVGVGKTTLLRAVARAVGGAYERIEGTIDLMPNDLVYYTYINDTGKPQVDPGPLLKHGKDLAVFFFNEVNRARPQVHSLLLRAMAERSVTAFSRDYSFPHLQVFADRNRIDLRASARDPWEQLYVRVYSQTSAVPVYSLVDLSASMGFQGRGNKIEVLCEFINSLGYSAYRTGDPCGFVACDTAVLWDFFYPLTRAKGAGAQFAAQLQDFVPTGTASQGLVAAAALLSKQPALVFLISDFHFSWALLEAILAALSRHRVVPVVLLDSSEYKDLPRFGIARIRDPETGRQRTLFMRRALREKIATAFQERAQRLVRECRRWGTEPLFIQDRFDANAVTEYFYG